MKQFLVFSLLGLSGLARWGAVAAPGAGEEGGGAEDASGAVETQDAPISSVTEAITAAESYKEPDAPGVVDDAAKLDEVKTADDPSALLEAEKTRLAGELEAARKEADALKAEQEQVKQSAALRVDLEKALASDLDRLEEAVAAGELTENEAAAQAEALAKGWLEDRAKNDELTKAKAELAELRAEKQKAETLASVQKLIAESPEMKVGGEAAQKSVLDLVLKGVDATEAVKQISEVVSAVAGTAVTQQKARDAAAAAAGPSLGGAAPAAGAGDEPATLTFSQALERAFSWNPG